MEHSLKQIRRNMRQISEKTCGIQALMPAGIHQGTLMVPHAIWTWRRAQHWIMHRAIWTRRKSL